MKKQNEKTASKTVKTLSPKEAAAKHIAAMQAAKQAELDAKTAMLADAAAGNETPAEVKPARIPRQKPVSNSVAPTIEEQHEAAASEAAANSGENLKAKEPREKPRTRTPEQIAADKQAVKQAKRNEYIKTAAIIAIKAGLLTRNNIEYRNSRDEVKAGDFAIYHNTQGFNQILQVEHISSKGTLTLEWTKDDAKNVMAGSAGAWTAESWDYNYLLNVFASKRESRDKKIEYVFFGKK